MEDLFDGEARPLLVWNGGSWTIRWSEEDGLEEPPPPVRHAEGYEPFVALLEWFGGAPEAFAADPPAVVRFVAEHGREITAAGLRDAAAVFLGNAFLAVHPRGVWQAAASPRVGGAGWSFDPGRILEVMAEEPERLDDLLPRLDGVEERERVADLQQAAMDAAGAVRDRIVLAGAPAFDRRSDDPMTLMADLAEWLVDVYRVDVTWAADRSSVELHPERGAPLRMDVEEEVGVRVRAGRMFDDFPMVSGQLEVAAADRLVRTVLAVTRGGLVEVPPTEPRTGAFALRRSDISGAGGGSDGAEDAPASLEALRALDGAAWPAWPRR